MALVLTPCQDTSIRDLWATSSVQDRYPSHQRTHRSPSTPRIEHEYALWVGNISETANILELRDFFLDPCPDDLLSISYHTSSRYAFANFRQDDARLTAIQYAAGNMFQGRRLDCRIRPNSSSRSIKVSYGLRAHETGEIAVGSPSYELGRKIEELTHFPECDPSQRGTKKFFVIKSFSLEAMYQSVATNQWYIPSRHAHRLNHAFQVSPRLIYPLLIHFASIESDLGVCVPDIRKSLLPPFRQQLWYILRLGGHDFRSTNSVRGSRRHFIASPSSLGAIPPRRRDHRREHRRE